MIIKNEKIMIFFGDAKLWSCNLDWDIETFDNFGKNVGVDFGLNKVLLNNQVHGVDGAVLDTKQTIDSFKNRAKDGDFLITNQRSIGIGVMTADCLPVLFYDKKNDVIAVVHAGWRGAIAGICKNAIDVMHKKFGTIISDLNVYFGPSAKSCCLEVQADFLPNLEQFTFKKDVIKFRDGRMFFDNILFNKLLIEEIGLDSQKINCDYNLCTICNHNFNSYRRNSKKMLRQISFIAMV